MKKFYPYLNLVFWFFLACLSSFSCKKDQKEVIKEIIRTQGSASSPFIFTIYGTQVGNDVKTGGVLLTGFPVDSIAQVGMCWSKLRNPKLSTAGDSVTTNTLDADQKQFISFITDLTPELTYYGCAYIITKAHDTLYGQAVPLKLSTAQAPAVPTGVVLALAATIANRDTIVDSARITYTDTLYKSDTSGGIIQTTAPYTYIFAPVSGTYTLTSTVTLTAAAGVVPNTTSNFTGTYPLHTLCLQGGASAPYKRIAQKVVSTPGTSQLSTTIHLNQGDSVSAVIVNGSNADIYAEPTVGMVRFEGYLLRAD